jgi:hypothetical protein
VEGTDSNAVQAEELKSELGHDGDGDDDDDELDEIWWQS